ncbi:MAG: hypothetical protein HY674_06335 [Chloroflexi bacterium]|nr:hypothetical protein [Chloroflexota bacterium]
MYAAQHANERLSLVVSAQGENLPMESADMAFDGDPKSKWLDYAGANTNRSSWIQWQYLSGEKAPVINLHRLRAVRPGAARVLRLGLEGVVISRSSRSHTLGFLDQTGFQLFELSSSVSEVEPGERVRLTGLLQFGEELPVVQQPELHRLGSLPSMPEVRPDQPFDEKHPFQLGAAEGRVTSVSGGPFYTTLGLTAEGGAGSLLARILKPERAPMPSLAN